LNEASQSRIDGQTPNPYTCLIEMCVFLIGTNNFTSPFVNTE